MDIYDSNNIFMSRNLRYYTHKNNIGLVSNNIVTYTDYDIIYSVLAHEEPEVLINFIKNIFYFNSTIKISIVLNCSEKLYSDINYYIKDIDGIFNNPYPSNKKWATYSLFESHLNNYIFFTHHLKLKFKYYIPLASNCMFHKQFTHTILNKELLNTYNDYRNSESIYDMSNYNNYWNWLPRIVIRYNKNIIELFKKDGIDIHISQVEGCIIDYDTMEYIKNYVEKNSIKELIDLDLQFEEFLFATLYFAKNKRGIPHMCKVYWNAYSFIKSLFVGNDYNVPTIQELNNTEEVCVKNIPRKMNNELRIYISEIANNYVQ